MLEVKNVDKYYGDFKAVDNLSFKVDKGEIFGLLGVNGAGKTTTFRMIMNLIKPSAGTITFNGRKIDYDITDKIGFLTEERSLLTKLTVKEQILFYGALKSLDNETILKRLDKLLERFEITDYKNRKINTLSKGNQQKVQFISAIINEPKLLILDEPFSGLDPINIELFKSVILELKEKEQKDKIEDLKGAQRDIAWGSQIRSYVFCPYTLVKDHRTNYETGNVEAVMNGELNEFMDAYLKQQIN